MRWETCREDFLWDGLRDIYITPVTLAEWQIVYSTVLSREAKYSVDGVAQPAPARVAEVFETRESAAPLLSIRAGRTTVVFHFFSESEIDCDIDPRKVTSQADLDALLTFMSQLGDSIQKPVNLTYENCPNDPILSYDPGTQDFRRGEPPSSEAAARGPSLRPLVTQQAGERVIADFAQYAFEFKLIDAAKVVAWADSLIGKSESPPSWLLDLALVDQSDQHAILIALRRVPGEPNLHESISLLCALVLREWSRGRLNIGQVRAIGWKLYTENHETLDFSKWGVVVECQGDELDNGFISEAEMRAVINRELAPFEEEMQRLPSWM
jgi:hypothetical protein